MSKASSFFKYVAKAGSFTTPTTGVLWLWVAVIINEIPAITNKISIGAKTNDQKPTDLIRVLYVWRATNINCLAVIMLALLVLRDGKFRPMSVVVAQRLAHTHLGQPTERLRGQPLRQLIADDGQVPVA